MGMNRTWSDDELREAVMTNTCIAHVISHLGLVRNGMYYKIIRREILRLSLDISHFVKLKRGAPNIRSLDEYLKEGGREIGSVALRNRLVKYGLLIRVCSICGITEWQKKPITIQLDHINGNRYDNRIENLRLLCPNCHSQTDTFAGRRLAKNFCSDCGKKVGAAGRRCRPCWTLDPKPTPRRGSRQLPSRE